MALNKFPPLPDSWKNLAKTPEQLKEIENEWQYFQCQKRKGHFRALVYEVQRQANVKAFYKQFNEDEKSNTEG